MREHRRDGSMFLAQLLDNCQLEGDEEDEDCDIELEEVTAEELPE